MLLRDLGSRILFYHPILPSLKDARVLTVAEKPVKKPC